jgi:hypothetical protein
MNNSNISKRMNQKVFRLLSEPIVMMFSALSNDSGLTNDDSNDKFGMILIYQGNQ